jgi:hypothetical protein
MNPTRFVRSSRRTTQASLLFLLPHGGQGQARRNAWAAMSADAVRARARREADAALSLAARRRALAALG